MDNDFLLARIEATKLQIVAYEDASAALVAGVQSYTLDTGQDRQTVTKFDLSQIYKVTESLYNRLATLEARLNGGTVTVRPAW